MRTLARGETLAALGGKGIGPGIKNSKRHLTKKERETGVRLLPDCGQTEASREKRGGDSNLGNLERQERGHELNDHG